MAIYVVIPARLASTRLKDKPLVDIGGMPMVARVMEMALRAKMGKVALAVDDASIADALKPHAAKHGELVRIIKTDPDLPSGSDRVHAALGILDIKLADEDIIVNLQGDMPFCPPSYLHLVADMLGHDTTLDVATLVAKLPAGQNGMPSKVKVAVSFAGHEIGETGNQTARALYFSRVPIPYGGYADEAGFGKGAPFYWGHVGIYAWRKKSLDRFVASPPSALEKREGLEQLRALDLGMKIGCRIVSHFPAGVDTPADLAFIRARYVKNELD